MLAKVFESQMKHNTKKDWISTVLKDIADLELNVTFVDIKQMSKKEWKNITKKSIERKTFENLENLKQNHSKVKENKYEKLEMQSYFLPNKHDCTKEEIQLIFKLLNDR